MAAEHDKIALALAETLWPELMTSMLCKDMSVSQLNVIYGQVASAALNTARQQLVAVASGQSATAQLGGDGVVAPVGLPAPDLEPAPAPEPEGEPQPFGEPEPDPDDG